MTFLKRAAAMAVTMVFLFSAAGAHATIVNRVAAVVDDQMITLLEVETASKPIVQAFANSPEAQKIDSVDLQARISEIKMKMLKEMIEQKLLEAEVKRLGIPDVPIPYAGSLEAAILPNEEKLTVVIKEVMEGR